jgi:DNA-binding response OmpR family regulator
VRIIVVSGSERSSDCLAGGADVFLEKPFMPEELYAALHA